MGGWNSTLQAAWYVRQTRSLSMLVLCSSWNIRTVFVNKIDDMVVGTQFHKLYGRPFARVLYLFLMKDIGWWLRWVLPGSTGRFYKDDVVHNHSAHGCYITRMEGGARYAWYWCYMLNRIKQNWAKKLSSTYYNSTKVILDGTILPR